MCFVALVTSDKSIESISSQQFWQEFLIDYLLHQPDHIIFGNGKDFLIREAFIFAVDNFTQSIMLVDE